MNFRRIVVSLLLLLPCSLAFGQSSSGADSSTMLISLAVVLALLFVFVFLFVADSLIQIEAKNIGGVNVSMWPKDDEVIPKRRPKAIANERFFSLKKGLDIPLKGEIESDLVEVRMPKTVAVQPPNFLGLSPIPKMHIEVGDKIKAGDPLFFDKQQPEVNYVSPVSGEVIAINRGGKRAILEVVIECDEEIEYSVIPKPSPASSREELMMYLAKSGILPLIRRRPYNTLVSLDEIPRDIFVSTFDTSPLPLDMSLITTGNESYIQAAVDFLSRLTTGKIYFGMDGNKMNVSSPFAAINGVERVWFKGAHPAGNVGVQIHHIAPVKQGDIVWTIGVQQLITIGKLLSEEKYDASRIIGLAGDTLNRPKYIKTIAGANVSDIIKDDLVKDNVRIISGTVLTGEKKDKNQFVNEFENKLTIIEEGDYYEMFGWLLPIKPRPSISNTFITKFIPDLKFSADTNTHGENRAFVVTGQYEKVLPMDILPQILMKSILTENYEKMVGLGILELVEEDIALCEFVCTSKQPLQQILRKGLDFVKEQE